MCSIMFCFYYYGYSVIIYPNKKRTDIMNIQKIIKVVRKAGKMFFDRKFDVEQKT